MSGLVGDIERPASPAARATAAGAGSSATSSRSRLLGRVLLLAALLLVAACPGPGEPARTPGAKDGPIPGDGASCSAQDEVPCPPGLSCLTPRPCPPKGPCREAGTCRLRCSDALPCPGGFSCQPTPSGQGCVRR